MKGTPGRCQVAVTRQAADRRRSFAGSRRSTLDKQSNWLFARLRPLLAPIRHQPKEFTMAYVDGFVLAVPKAKLDDYKKLAQTAGVVWKEHGALAYVECVGDDVPYGEITSFPRAVQAKDDEIVIFSWVVYESRQSRDAVMAKVMADPRLKTDWSTMPFDGKRMIFGGFQPFMGL
jgi:uncharacterized protein YbaA (DUF1428 family)